MGAPRLGNSPYFGDNDDSSSYTKTNSCRTSTAPSTHNGVHETSPLLNPVRRGQVVDPNATVAIFGRPILRHTAALLLIILIVGVASCGDQIMESPQARIFESVICYRYYERVDPTKLQISREAVGPGAVGGVDEMFCKVNEVQELLALLRGYQQFFDGIPALVLAVPFGWAADRFGRKPILVSALLSLLLRTLWIQIVTWFWQAFDVRMVWLSTLTALMSGGTTFLSALVFVILSDIAPEEERASAFLQVGAVNLSAQLLMPPLAALLMRYSPWIPNLAGLILMMTAITAALFLPETLGFRHTELSPSSSRPPTPSTETIPAPPDPSDANLPINANFAAPIAKVHEATSFLFKDWRVPTLILPFLSHVMIMTAMQMIMQYISKRYHLTFADATLLMTIFSGAKVLLLFALLPALSNAVMRIWRLSSQEKDLYLARGSMIVTILGYTLIGLSPNIPAVTVSMVIASLGLGAHVLIRSFLTSLVPAHQIAKVYSVISVVDTVGMMFGGALLAGLFNEGLRLGGAWIGLPFMFIGGFSLVFTILLFLVRLRPGEGKRAMEEEGEH